MKIKTKQELKDNYAKSLGYYEFKCLLTDGSISKYDLSIHYDRMMKEYAKSIAQQALENAADNFKGASQFALDVRESILNADNIPTI